MEALSAITKILVAAVNLEERGKIPFTEIELILEAWKRFPFEFGIKGYEQQYPDTHMVICAIMGRMGLFKKGLLDKTNCQQLVLTPQGRSLAHEMTKALELEVGTLTPTPLPSENGLSKKINFFLDKIINSSAYKKFHFQEKEKICLREAQEFWILPDNLKGEVVVAFLDEFTAMLNKIQTIMKGTSGELVLHNGRAVLWDDMAKIVELDEYLRKRFGSILKLLQRRTIK